MGRQRIDYPAMGKPNLLDIAWAAGIFEGEGNIGLDAGKRVHIQVVQKDRWILDKLARLFGGKVYEAYVKKTHLTYYLWRLNHDRMNGFLFTIYTFLSPRRRIEINGYLGK